MPKNTNGGFQKTVSQRQAVDVQSTKVVDTSLAKTISLVGKHAMSAAKGYQHAKLEGTPEQDLPIKEMPAATAAYIPGEGTGNLLNVTDVGGETLVDPEVVGDDPFHIPSDKVLDPDVELSFNQIAKARKQGLIGSEEAESRIEAATRAAINRMPGQAGEFRRAAGEFFGKFGPGGSVLRKTSREKVADHISRLNAIEENENYRIATNAGVSVDTVRQAKAKAQLAQLNKVLGAENLAQFSGATQQVLGIAYDGIVTEFMGLARQGGGVLSTQARTEAITQLQVARQAAISEMERTPGFMRADFSSQKAAKDALDEKYRRTSEIFQNVDAGKILTDMNTESTMAHREVFARNYPSWAQLTAATSPEVANSVAEILSKNYLLFEKLREGNVKAAEDYRKKFIRDPRMAFAKQMFDSGNFDALSIIERESAESHQKAYLNQRIDPQDPSAGTSIDSSLDVITGRKVQPGSNEGVANTNMVLNYARDGDYLAITDLEKPSAQQHVRATPGAIDQLSDLLQSRIRQDVMLLQESSRRIEESALYEGIEDSIFKSTFGSPDVVRQQILETGSVNMRILKAYPELWKDKFNSAEDFVEAILEAVAEVQNRLRTSVADKEIESASSNIQDLDVELAQINELIRQKNAQ